MNETLEATDTMLFEELADELPCQGDKHPNGGNGHDPEQFAKWWLKAPCCFAMQLMVCDARRTYILSMPPNELLRCDICGKGFVAREWHFDLIKGDR